MSDDQFTKLFTHMEKRFTEMSQEIGGVREQVSRVYDAVDGVAKRIDTDDAERAAIARQLTRHEHWIEQIAAKLDVTLDYQEN
jgi:phage-related tail protein